MPRYIYIPLGGSKRLILNCVVVFSFVALWHDLSFKLLAWGWLVSLFIVPELVARWILPWDVVRTVVVLLTNNLLFLSSQINSTVSVGGIDTFVHWERW